MARRVVLVVMERRAVTRLLSGRHSNPFIQEIPYFLNKRQVDFTLINK